MINGELIKRIRIERGLSQEELGNLLGVTKVSICGYETGTRTPTMQMFLKLLDILNVTPNQLIGQEIMTVAEGQEPYEFPITKQELTMIQKYRHDECFRMYVQKELK